MTLLIISMSVLVYIIILLCFYPIAKRSDLKRKRLNAVKGIDATVVDDEFEEPFFKRAILPIFTGILKVISNLLPKNKNKKNKTQKIERDLRLAGINISAGEYNAARLMLAGGALFLVLIINMFIYLNPAIEMLILILSVLFSIVAPGFFIKARIKKRQAEIEEQLPDVLDLLCVSMEAGLGFDASLIKIGERLKGLLVSELSIVHAEIKLGKARRDALRSLADRSSVEGLATFISSLIQAEQLGIPINNVLKTQAQEIRTKKRQTSEAKAMKAPVKMMIPLVMFVFPVLFIILLGPTIIELIGQFGG